MRRRISGGRASALVVACVLGTLGFSACSVPESDHGGDKLNTDGIRLLLAALDTLAVHNPGWEMVADSISGLTSDSQVAAIEALAAKNRQNKAVRAAVEAVVGSPAYERYYARFKNMTPDIHRNILYALPFAAINSPAGIADNLRLLCRKRAAVAAWADTVLPKINLTRCRTLAEEWLPKGEYSIPVVYFILDGNGDAFASKGEVEFDLYGAVFSRVAPDFEDLDRIGVNSIELILGHELHHVFADEHLPTRGLSTGYNRVVDDIQRRLTSEGIAKQIDGLRQRQREIFEDSQVVRYWIGQLNEHLAQVKMNSDRAPEFSDWMSTTYHDGAINQLRDFLGRDLSGPSLDSAVRKHASDRPSLVYTLGWWMIQNISRQGTDKEVAIGLLSEPDRLFATYNAVMASTDPTLRIVW